MSEGKREDDAPTEIGSLRVFPTVRKDDPEDVSWALSTAEAMWNRGDASEAIKWIRRAAEAASECERDDRALELAKVAADLASLSPKEQTLVVVPKPAGAPAAPAVTMKQAAPLPPTPIAPPVAPAVTNKPPSVPPPATTSPLPPGVRKPAPAGLTPPMPMARPAGPTTTPTDAKPPAAATTTPTNAKPPAAPASPLTTPNPGSAAGKPGLTPRAPLAPKHTPTGTAKPGVPAGATAVTRPVLELVPQSRASLEAKVIEAKNGIRIEHAEPPEDRPTRVGNSLEASSPDLDGVDPETTSEVAVPVMPGKGRNARGVPERKVIIDDGSDDMDGWPTTNMSGKDMDEMGGERTRVHVPVYKDDGESQTRAKTTRSCQAVKVVLYRAPDGSLRIAPHGAPVSAVKVEAMLVALEPGADLLTWLSSD